MHVDLVRKYISIVITCKNYEMSFVNLLGWFMKFGWWKPNNPWVFIPKLKQGQLYEQDFTLIFEKWCFLASCIP